MNCKKDCEPFGEAALIRPWFVFLHAPAVVCFGKISALTAGGSGRFQENVRLPMGMGMGMMGMIMGCVPMRNPPPGDPCNLP